MATNIKHKLIVLSGKGGVGKSSVAVSLAVWLSVQGKRAGLLDVDIHGPSVPKMLGIGDRTITAEDDRVQPIDYSDHLKVMSIGFMLPNDDEALIWRGPMKHNLIQQFVENVDWGRLDYLVVDCPPGTGDEPLSLVQVLGSADGAVIVTTPQELAAVDVRKCITFCKRLNLPVLGIVENMSGFVCPHCKQRSDIFAGHSGQQMAADFHVPFLGGVPIDPDFGAAGDNGKPFIAGDAENTTVQALRHVFNLLLETCERNGGAQRIDAATEEKPSSEEEGDTMRVAIPLTAGRLTAHFGHCEQFAIVDVDRETMQIQGTELLTPPAHQPGVLPQWLSGIQVNLVIAGGMGQRAQQLFAQNGIEVLCGATEAEPEQLVKRYLEGELALGENICDH